MTITIWNLTEEPIFYHILMLLDLGLPSESSRTVN